MSKHRSKIMESAFTLVELLIVIGIIGVLSVTLLISLNPAEAQKKTRDVKRLKDLQTLQSIVEQAFADGVVPTAGTCDTGVAGATTCNSHHNAAGTAITLQQQPCNANFLQMNVCNYAKFVPLDALNGRTTACRNAAAAAAGCQFGYWFNSNGGTDYELNARQESTTATNKLTGDAGNSNSMVEIFTNSNNLISNVLNPL